MKKLFLCVILLFPLIFTGCGGGGNSEDSSNPVPTQPDIDNAGPPLIVNVEGIGQATFSPDYAATNPEIKMEKIQDEASQIYFDDSKQTLEIQDGSDFEVRLTSSNELISEFDITLNVPENLITQINENNVIAIYVEVPEDDDQMGMYLPLSSTFDPTNKTVSAKVLEWALGNTDIKFKLGLAKIFDKPAEEQIVSSTLIAAQAKTTEEDFKGVGLPIEGAEAIQQIFKNYPCPLLECIETSRFGQRKQKDNTRKLHAGIDLRAVDQPVLAVEDGIVSAIINSDGIVEVSSPATGQALRKVRYTHLKLPLPEVGTPIGFQKQVGISSFTNKQNKPESEFKKHLHLEVYLANLPANKDNKVMFGPPVDPFPYFVHSLKIVNPSKIVKANKTDTIGLALETKTVNGVKVDSEIIVTTEPPIGTPRDVLWKSSNEKGAKIDGIKRASAKSGSTATLTINEIQPATITAQWDGMGEHFLQAEFPLTTVFQDINFTAVLTTQSDCPGDSGTENVTGTFKSLDPNKPTYNIQARNVSFNETIPAVGSQTQIYPEEGGTTTDSYVYKIDFEGFEGSGTYQFVRLTPNPETGEISRFVCNGTYTIQGTFIK